MVKRYYGGVMSKTPLAPSTNSAKGFWGISQQLQAQAAGWPLPGLPGMPAAYTTLINSFNGTKYYLDAVNGNDLNNGTSSTTAWATYSKFATITSGISSNIMLIVLSGTYTLSSINLGNGYAEVCISDYGYPRQIVCAPGSTTFNWNADGGQRDAPFFNLASASSNIYGGTFKRNSGARSTSYMCAFFGNTTASFIGKVYNLALVETGTYWSFNYANAGFPAGSEVNQCSLYTPAAGLGSYAGTGLTVNNGTGNYVTNGTVTFNNYLVAPMNSSTYITATATNQGVYYGTYAWL